MTDKRNISDNEANALIDQYLNGGNTEAKKEDVVSPKEEKTVDVIEKKQTTESVVDDKIDNYFNEKFEKDNINLITSKGASFVTRTIINNRNINDHKSNRLIIENFDTRSTDAPDFAMLLNQLIAYKAHKKIRLHVEHLINNTKSGLEELQYFVGRSINSYYFRNEEEKNTILTLLRMK